MDALETERKMDENCLFTIWENKSANESREVSLFDFQQSGIKNTRTFVI